MIPADKTLAPRSISARMSYLVMGQLYRRARDEPSELPWYREEPSQLLAQATHTLGPGAKVLDVGCGAGTLSTWLARRGFEVTGVDLFPEAVRLASASAEDAGLDIRFILGDVFSIDLADDFDLVYDSGCLHSLVGGSPEAYKRKVLEWLGPHSRNLTSTAAPSCCSRPSSSSTPSRPTLRVGALVPPPRVHRHRYHGVLAPNARLRPHVVAFGRPELVSEQPAAEGDVAAPSPSAEPTPAPASPAKGHPREAWVAGPSCSLASTTCCRCSVPPGTARKRGPVR